MKVLFWFGCLVLLVQTSWSQQDFFRGQVRVKSYDLLNSSNESATAKTLAEAHNLPLSKLDTLIYRHDICQDTIVTRIETRDGLTLEQNIEFGDYWYIYDSVFHLYLRVQKSTGRFNGATAADWKHHRKPKQRGDFAYEYSLVKPGDQKLLFFATLDTDAAYAEQAALGGWFANTFHPEGNFERLIFHNGYTDVLFEYDYRPDPDLSCAEYFEDFFVKDMVEDAREMMDYGTNTEIIPVADRRPLVLETVHDTSLYRVPSLAEFAGRYVYVDLWASWCAPCRIEMPFMARLRKQYPEEQLALLSISLDERKAADAWLQSIPTLRMNWINWIVYGGFESDFARTYNITAIPRYLLLDPQGRIVNANAPRPSDERLGQLLDQLIERTKP